MVDEFLLEKIREKMKEKGATLASVKESFENVYREKDIDLAMQEYQEEEERRVTIEAEHFNEEFSRRKERSFWGSIISFIFNQPYIWIAVSLVVFIRVYQWRASIVTFSSSMKEMLFLFFLILIFTAILLFISRATGWVATFNQMPGKKERLMLRGVQLQAINLIAILGIIRIAETNPPLVIIIFVVTAAIFEIVLMSLIYLLDFKGALATFLFFQLTFFALWFCGSIVLNLVFPLANA